jgi:endoglucanase
MAIGHFTDEFAWAAAELYITTKNDAYYAEIGIDSLKFDIPGWPNVQTLGLLSLLVNRDK